MIRTRFLTAALFACGLFASGLAHAAEARIPQAQQLLDQLDAGQFEAATENFTPEMLAAADASALASIWASLPLQVGEATGRGEPQALAQGGYEIVVIPLHYTNATLNAIVSFDADGRIAGFLLQPAEQ